MLAISVQQVYKNRQTFGLPEIIRHTRYGPQHRMRINICFNILDFGISSTNEKK